MRPVAIVQARMGSTRLPGKVLLPLAGRTVLWHVVARLRAVPRLEGRVVVATTHLPEDDAIEHLCGEHQIPCYRGHPTDLLDRYHRAARWQDADPVVRVTADCPCVDPQIVQEVVAGYGDGTRWDSYGLGGSFPDGLDVMCYSRRAIDIAWAEATLPYDREHVGPFIEQRPGRFEVGWYQPFTAEHGAHRWTLDEPVDYALLQAVFAALWRPERHFSSEDVIVLLEREPALRAINAHVRRSQERSACDRMSKESDTA